MDVYILKLLNSNDEKAIGEIKRQYGNRIKYIVLGIIKNASDAEECENDIYNKIWNNRTKFRAEKGSLYAWISAISRNTSLNYLKKVINEFDELKEDDCISLSPEDETEQRQNTEMLTEVIKQLSEEEKNLFLRRYYYLQSISQIASETGKSERATEGKLYRLRKKLQKKLGGDFNA